MKKLVALLLTFALALSLCSVAFADEELVTLKILCNNDYSSEIKTEDWKKYAASQELIEALAERGIAIELECIDRNSIDNVIKTRMAAGVDLPDIVSAVFCGPGKATIAEWGADGLVVPINEILDKYDEDGSVMAYWNEQAPGTLATNIASDGNLYWFCYLSGGVNYYQDIQSYSKGYNWRTLSIRADWVEKVGETVKLCYTPDELFDLLMKFQEQDVNGNGLKDEVICVGIDDFDEAISDAFWLSKQTLTYVDQDGKATSNFYNPNLTKYLEFMKKLYDNGLYDTSAMTTNNMTHELITNNKAAVTYNYALWADYERQILAEGALYVPFILDMDGDMTNGFKGHGDIGTTTYGQYFVTSACKNLEAVAKLLDYLYSDEYRKLSVVGPSYTYSTDENGKLIYHGVEIAADKEKLIAELGEEAGTEAYNIKYFNLLSTSVGLYALPPMNCASNLESYLFAENNPDFDISQEAEITTPKRHAWEQISAEYYAHPDNCWYEEPLSLSLYSDEEYERLIEIDEDLNTYAAELLTDIILGRRDISTLEDGVKQLEKLGLKDYVEITQARYDRAHSAE